MLMTAAARNGTIDRITGRSTANGPTVDQTVFSSSNYGAQFQLYTGPQVPIGTALTTIKAASSAGLFPWQAAGGGISTISEPIVTTNVASGTVDFVRVMNPSYSPTGFLDFSLGVAGSGKECIVDTLTAGTPTILNCSLKLALNYGGMEISDALANCILSYMFGPTQAANMGGSGHIYVYTDSAPANAGDAATGTLLLDFPTTTTSFNSASAGSASLSASISAVAGAGAAATPGYARWVKGGYVIQGTVGTTGTVFIIDSMSVTSGNTYNLTSATITI